MQGKIERDVKVKCQDCPFVEAVAVDDRRLPAEVVIEHGRETGHRLRIEHLE